MELSYDLEDALRRRAFFIIAFPARAGQRKSSVNDKSPRAIELWSSKSKPALRTACRLRSSAGELLTRIPKIARWRPRRGAMLRVRLFQVSTASGTEPGSIMRATLATARGTDLEPSGPPARMPIRIGFHTHHKGDHNGQTNVPFLWRRPASGARPDVGG